MNNLHKLENENESKHLWRLGRAKDDGLLDISWSDITNVLNEDWHSGDERTEKTYKNRYLQARIFFEDGMFGTISSDDELLKNLTEQKHEIKKEKQKLFDERRDLNAKLRASARYEEDVERIFRMFQDIGKERYFEPKVSVTSGNKTMIVCLSDLHVGSEWAHHTGFFSPITAKERLEEYCGKIIEIAKLHNISKCIVVFLGDGISGSIHKSIQVTNKENTVDQVKLVCEYISDFIYELSKNFTMVEFHSVGGNHSRMDKKEDALVDERLDSLIPWFLKHMFTHINNINIVVEELDSTMCSFEIGDKIYVGVHGDYDGMNDAAIAKLVMWLGFTPTGIIMGHKHHHAMTEVAGVKVIQSGSLCGTGDDFTRSKRLKGNPSQTLMICDECGLIEAVYPIELL